MATKSLGNLLGWLGIGIIILMVGIKIVEPVTRKPVGIPRPYTTFMAVNITATAPKEVVTPSPRLPACSDLGLPNGDFIVLRIWTNIADKELFRIDTNGNNMCQLTENDVVDDQPTISPDGKKIAFVSYDKYGPGIFIMDSDGKNRVRLTGGGSAYSFPDWSPDGNKLVFQATINELFDLYTINSDGSDLRNLTNDVTLDTMPDWSPDGKRIAFASDRTFDPQGYVEQGASYEIYVMDSDGTNVQRLTYNERIDFSSVWSPDGHHIAYISGNQIHVITDTGFDIGNPINLQVTYPNSLAWLPDGHHIAFTSELSSTIATLDTQSFFVEPFIRIDQQESIAEIDGWWP